MLFRSKNPQLAINLQNKAQQTLSPRQNTSTSKYTKSNPMPLQTNTSLIGENRYYETIKNLLNKKYGNKRQTAKAERTMLKYESLSNAKKEEINKILKTKPSLKPTRKEIALRKKISKINRASNYLIKREAVQNYLAMKNELRELITAKTNVNDPKMQKLVAQILILKIGRAHV